ncbi:class I SAM-dependent methyltransferase [Flagellimonas sp. GZD32]|uniref:class I SAM-dependent methyltransferase n=1 Tax=Flagellimonas cixiensis TaxID=3228750 RepID=UPI0035C904DB
MSVLLQKPIFEGITQKELAEQLEARKKCQDKLPSWFNSKNIYYPNKLNIEQTSSEQTAHYKAQIVGGKTLIDLTGGYGVDSYFFASKMARVLHCEINSELSEIARYNFEVLGQKNVECFAEDGIEFLKNSTQHFDWVFVDPSRRNDKKGKVFLWEDCLPNLPENLTMIFEKTDKVLVKASPIFDIAQGIKELQCTKEVHVVAVNNEVKELLFVLEKGFEGEIQIKTVNLLPHQEDHFNFILAKESSLEIDYGAPQEYVYEPNAAILKSGGFRSVAAFYKVTKLHPHSHLYTSLEKIDFPGRIFKIEQVLPYTKKSIKSLGLTKANITTRNFPMTVADIRKKFKIKDGGEHYLFFTKNTNDSLLIVSCKKV